MKKGVLTAILTLLCLVASAQSKIRVEAPNLVAVDEKFNVTFVVEGERPSDFQWQCGEHFDLLWGPSKGSSTSISIINGKKTSSSQTTYTYVLSAREKGRFTLPPATATIGGASVSSTSVSVEVVTDGAASSGGGASSAGAAPSQGNAQAGAASQGSVGRDDLFLRMIPSRTSVVVGEPVSITLKLYQRVNIAGFEDARFPSFNGCWSQEVEAPSSINFQRESVNDQIYNSALLRRYVIIPQQAGTLTVDPAELVCLVQVRSNRRSNDPFEMFFHDDYTTLRKRVRTGALTLHVSPLPAGAPGAFGGGVGNFRITASLSRDSLKTHDAASLSVTVSGTGNVSLLEAPKVSFPPDFEVYDVKVSEKTDKASGGTRGSKTFEYPFIPRSGGDFTLPPISYAYYDVQAGRYVTLTVPEMTLHVARGAQEEAAAPLVQAPAPDRQGVKNLGEDIRYISTRRPALRREGAYFLGSPTFWTLLALLLAASLGYDWVYRRRAERRSDVALMKNRRATRMARGRLKQAGRYLEQNLYTAFYEELHKALLGFFADKLNLPASELSRERIGEALLADGVLPEETDSALGLLDACEFARYAPDAGHEAMDAHYRQALDVIAGLDAQMKSPAGKGRRTAAASLLALLLCLPGLSVRAQEKSDSLWNAACAAYAEGRYAEAAASWEAIRCSGWTSPSLLTNEGNAWYKAGEPARAILCYERALRLDPSFADAKANLAFVNGRIKDRIDPVPEFIFERWGRALCYLFPSDVWAVLMLVSLAALLVCVLLFRLARRPALRKGGFFLALVFLLLMLLSWDFAAWQKREATSADKAVVTAPVSAVSSAPGTDAQPLFILHEGTKVTILETVGEWHDIALSDGRQGWLKASQVEII